MLLVKELIAKLQELPQELQDAPVLIHSDGASLQDPDVSCEKVRKIYIEVQDRWFYAYHNQLCIDEGIDAVVLSD